MLKVGVVDEGDGGVVSLRTAVPLGRQSAIPEVMNVTLT